MCSNNVAIRVSNLGKRYEIYQVPQDRLKQFVLPRLQRFTGLTRKDYFKEFWALQDISIEIEKGEAVGIIGRNGAGKSTLLQLICGTLSPTNGFIEVNGVVAALLELGSGFNPDFTGRENVYLNASLLGLTRKEIDEKFDEIATFADIGDFLEQPTKTYSSGMLMRLAFAVNTCVEPEILIVDEALGVGDAPFQSKCFKRLKQLLDSDTTILFVSHDISTVRSICNRALWLKDGKAIRWGSAKEVGKEYEKFCWQEQGVVTKGDVDTLETRPKSINTQLDSDNIDSKWRDTIINVSENNFLLPVKDPTTQMGNKDVLIAAISTTNSNGEPVKEFQYGEDITVHYKILSKSKIDSEFMIGIRVRNLKGDFICSFNDVENIYRLNAEKDEVRYARVTINLPLTHGDYILRTGIFGFKDGIVIPGDGYDFSRAVLWDVREDAMYFKVLPCKIMPRAGPVNLRSNLKFWIPTINN